MALLRFSEQAFYVMSRQLALSAENLCRELEKHTYSHQEYGSKCRYDEAVVPFVKTTIWSNREYVKDARNQ